MPRKVFWYPFECTTEDAAGALPFISPDTYDCIEEAYGFTFWEKDADVAPPVDGGMKRLAVTDVFHICGHGGARLHVIKSNHGEHREISAEGAMHRMIECEFPKDKNIKIVLYCCFSSSGGSDSLGSVFATSLKVEGEGAYPSAEGNIWGLSMRAATRKYGVQLEYNAWSDTRTKPDGTPMPHFNDMADEPDNWQIFPCKPN